MALVSPGHNLRIADRRTRSPRLLLSRLERSRTRAGLLQLQGAQELTCLDDAVGTLELLQLASGPCLATVLRVDFVGTFDRLDQCRSAKTRDLCRNMEIG